MSRLPDLVHDTRLNTSIQGDFTIHHHDDSDDENNARSILRSEHWKTTAPLGGGAYGEVWLQECVKGKRACDRRAVKIIPRLKLKDKRDNYVTELEAIAKFSQKLYSKCFVKLLGWYDTDSSLCIAMEYFPLGDLQNYMSKNGPINEADAREISFQVLEGLSYMHREGFAHRDIKPGNVLIRAQPPKSNWWVKISDFGISKRVEGPKQAMTSDSGTTPYMAPELLFYEPGRLILINHEAADIWALGEMTYRMLTQTAAFPTANALHRYLVYVDPFPTEDLSQQNASSDATSFIHSLMQPQPEKRLTSEKAMEHAWVASLKDHLAHVSKSSAPTPLDLSFPSRQLVSTLNPSRQLISTPNPNRQPVSTPNLSRQLVLAPNPNRQLISTPNPNPQPVSILNPNRQPVSTLNLRRQLVSTPNPSRQPVSTLNPNRQPVLTNPSRQPVLTPNPDPWATNSSDISLLANYQLNTEIPDARNNSSLEMLSPMHSIKTIETKDYPDTNSNVDDSIIEPASGIPHVVSDTYKFDIAFETNDTPFRLMDLEVLDILLPDVDSDPFNCTFGLEGVNSEDKSSAGKTIQKTGHPKSVQAASCTQCQTPFSFTNEEYLCPNCDRFFDSKCSSKRTPIWYMEISEPVRVDDACFASITGKMPKGKDPESKKPQRRTKAVEANQDNTAKVSVEEPFDLRPYLGEMKRGLAKKYETIRDGRFRDDGWREKRELQETRNAKWVKAHPEDPIARERRLKEEELGKREFLRLTNVLEIDWPAEPLSAEFYFPPNSYDKAYGKYLREVEHHIERMRKYIKREEEQRARQADTRSTGRKIMDFFGYTAEENKGDA